MQVWEAAVEVLKETDNPAVMWGDEGLCHLIADRLGWEHKAWETSDRVLAALAKTPGKLVKRKTVLGNGRVVNVFRLQEEAN
jgi:hypothetical protein